uniref:G0/G1 switch 2 n=1 Tax=Xiphophorus maculatus TaxID=8083 RepID=M4AYD6_XIPMA
METMQELIPFAKEMLRQRANRKLLGVYLLGSVLAVLGTAVGLVETLSTIQLVFINRTDEKHTDDFLKSQ